MTGAAALMRTGKKRAQPQLADGLPKGFERKIETLDDYERGSLEQLLASRISIAPKKRVPMAVVQQHASIVVDDPFEQGAKLTVTRNIRNDPLARLHSHRQIDDAQFYAGRAYQRDWENAERGARAIDPTKEAVDGGRFPEPLSDSQAKAIDRVASVEVALGRTMTRVIQAVLIHGMSMEVMALKMFGRHGEVASKYYGRLFRDALDDLAVEYNLASK
jgi:hypothetical protein